MRLKINMLGRDSQRRKLYRAENAAYAQFAAAHPKFRDTTEYQQFLNGIMRSEWMRTNFPEAVMAGPVKVVFSTRMGGANANANRIKTGVGAFALNPLILCHELSHTIVRREYGRSMYACGDSGRLVKSVVGLVNYCTHRIAGHGPEYADVYLRVVREFLGYEAWKILRASFDKAGIRYAAPSEYCLPQRQPRFVMAGSFAKQSITTTVRNTNPSYSAKVRVDGVEFQSMWVAYQQLLPGASAAHMQRNRIQLKKFGVIEIIWNERRFIFQAVPK